MEGFAVDKIPNTYEYTILGTKTLKIWCTYYPEVCLLFRRIQVRKGELTMLKWGVKSNGIFRQ